MICYFLVHIIIADCIHVYIWLVIFDPSDNSHVVHIIADHIHGWSFSEDIHLVNIQWSLVIFR